MNEPTTSGPPQAELAQPEVNQPAAGQPSAETGVSAGGSRFLPVLALLIALIVFALTAWQWYDNRGQGNVLQLDLARKFADIDTHGKESRIIAEQARGTAADAQVKIGVLENRLAESQNQQIALEALYQELSRNRDEWAYAEIEQSLLIANQQLQLAGNVRLALIALQAADGRLQRMERPQLTNLRKAINRDIEHLKSLPNVDAVGISVRIDNIIAAVDTMPLAMEVRPPAEKGEAVASQTGGGNVWTRFWIEAWGEFRQMVRIQRMDKPDVPLLEPAQVFFLRENLKLRLIGARLSLLSHDAVSFKTDLKAAHDWFEKYYDIRDKSVLTAITTLNTLHGSEISIELPDISATLDALRNYRATARERPGR
jgi:uroporphyrin-3 C-methyltransferase